MYVNDLITSAHNLTVGSVVGSELDASKIHA